MYLHVILPLQLTCYNQSLWLYLDSTGMGMKSLTTALLASLIKSVRAILSQ